MEKATKIIDILGPQHFLPTELESNRTSSSALLFLALTLPMALPMALTLPMALPMALQGYLVTIQYFLPRFIHYIFSFITSFHLLDLFIQ